MKDLSLRELKVCTHYLKTCDKYESMIYGGYTHSTAKNGAYIVFNRPRVKKYLEEKMREAAEGAGMSISYRFNKLRKATELCIPEGAEHHEECNIKDGLDAIDTVNKMCGDYAPTKSVNENHNSFNSEELNSNLDQDEQDIKAKFEREF